MKSKTFWDKWFRVAVGLCVVMLLVTIWGVGRQQRRCVEAGVDGPVDVVRESGWDALVGAGEQEATNSFGPVELKMPKTNVSLDGWGYSMTFKHAIWPGMDSLDLYGFGDFTVSLGSLAMFQITGVTDSGHPGQYGFLVTATPEPFIQQTFWTDVPESGYTFVEIELAVTGIGSCLECTAGENPIGDKTSTHAKERTIAENWFIPANASYTISVNDFSETHTTTADIPSISAITVSGNALDCDDWSPGYYSMLLDEVKFNGVGIDVSGFDPITWGGTAASVDKLWMRGVGDHGIGFYVSEAFYNGAYVYNTLPSSTINAPLSYDFSNMSIRWMDGTPVKTVEVTCTGIRQIVNGHVIDVPWKGTLAELKALGRITQKYGCYFWDAEMAELLPTVSLYMDYSSMREHGMFDHAKPTIKVEGAMYGVTGTEESPTTSPVDGDYWLVGIHNTKGLYSNGAYFIFALDTDGADWGIGPAQSVPPYYMTTDGGGIYNVYVVNEYDEEDNPNGYIDAVLDTETGQKRFSGWSGLGPAVSQQLAPADPDTSTPSFAHDATLIIDGWGVDATDRTSSPYMLDVAKITHSDWTGGDQSTVNTAGCPIYKDGHDHTDWVGDGCTVPDAGGNFTVNASGGTLTLSLRSYYIARQAGTYIALPNRYWVRKADFYYGSYPTQEPLHEGVYDWRGWSYLKSKFGLPEGLESTDVTVTLQYYNDLDGVSDNHMSASERDAGYSYDPGEVLSYTKEAAISVVESGEATFITDLYWAEEPLAIVKSIKFTFTDTGDYKIYEPALVSDQGDPQTGRVAYVHPTLGYVNHGGMHKFFESPRYAQGGFSSVYDGIFDRQMYIPDSAKANQHEYCFPTLNVLIGQGTGQDLTTVLSLAGLPMSSSCEAWVWTHSATAEAAHMKDVDGVVLKTLTCSDIVPVMSGADIWTAVRCYQITCVRGLPYTFYGTHYVGGAGHGMCKTTGGERKRGTYHYTDVADLYERPMESTDEGDYVVAEDDVRVDEHGHWHDGDSTTGGGQPTDGEQNLYEWAIKGNEYVSLGQFYTREYSVADVVLVTGGGVYVVEWKRNMIFVFEHAPEGIQHLYTSPPEHYYSGGRRQTGYDLPKLDVAETDGSPAGYLDKNAKLYLYHVLDGTLKKLVSTDLGQNWSEATDVITGQSISKAIELYKDGVSYCLAVTTDGAFYCYRSKNHFTGETWAIGTNKFEIETGVEEVQPGGYFAGDKLYAFIGVGEDRKGYQSGDLGRTWAEIT